MQFKRTIYRGLTLLAGPTILPIEDLPYEDKIRSGFEQGTLLKATFETTAGVTIVYERVE